MALTLFSHEGSGVRFAKVVPRAFPTCRSSPWPALRRSSPSHGDLWLHFTDLVVLEVSGRYDA